MESILNKFSSDLADLVESAAKSAVGVEGRHRMGSSGFLWKSNLIVTADHALRRDESIPVIFPDGRRTSADLAGRDPGTDLALLRVTGAPDAPELASASTPRTGEVVVAVGRYEPGILAATGTIGSVGGPWKTWRGGQLDTLLRLEIPAWPRTSGSLVIDTQGRFLGMFTAGVTRTAPIAIPASTIDRVAAQLAEHGKVTRGYLGIGMQPIALPPAFSQALNRDQNTGVMVLSVQPDGPAERAGILLGDVVVELGTHAISDTDDVQTALLGAIGKQLTAVLFRGGERIERQVTVGERKA